MPIVRVPGVLSVTAWAHAAGSTGPDSDAVALGLPTETGLLAQATARIANAATPTRILRIPITLRVNVACGLG